MSVHIWYSEAAPEPSKPAILVAVPVCAEEVQAKLERKVWSVTNAPQNEVVNADSIAVAVESDFLNMILPISVDCTDTLKGTSVGGASASAAASELCSCVPYIQI